MDQAATSTQISHQLHTYTSPKIVVFFRSYNALRSNFFYVKNITTFYARSMKRSKFSASSNASLRHIRPARALSFSKRYGKLDMYLTPAQNLHVCMHMQLHLS